MGIIGGIFKMNQISYMNKFISSITKQIRSCYIYKNFTDSAAEKFVKKYKLVVKETDFYDLHFAPLTLTDIVGAIICKRMDKGLDLSADGIKLEFFDLLYTNKLRYTILTKPAHTILHDNEILIAESHMVGAKLTFFNKYKDYLPDPVIAEFKLYYNKQP
jgi:hypothetical protein